MRKKMKTIYFIFLFAFIAGTMNLFSLSGQPSNDDEESNILNLDFYAGLNASFNTTQIKIGPEKLTNSLVYSYLALEVNADVTDFLNLGLVAGFSSNHFKNPVNFETLPLSLSFDKKNYNSLILGLNAASEFSMFGDFSLLTRGEFLYFTPFKKESEISLPVVNGKATSQCSFYQADIELLCQYDGFSTLTVFFGPQLFLANGKYKASETIADIKGDASLNFKQKNFFGIVGGINFDLGENFNVNLSANLISKTAVSARVLYVF
ncbi:MAG: hypothetical protein MUF15_25850 [Acidobacteria bacterium]|jgi:hypothetical protein|nr:hypothetical protein [Acidobacteriota bacterium]